MDASRRRAVRNRKSVNSQFPTPNSQRSQSAAVSTFGSSWTTFTGHMKCGVPWLADERCASSAQRRHDETTIRRTLVSHVAELRRQRGEPLNGSCTSCRRVVVVVPPKAPPRRVAAAGGWTRASEIYFEQLGIGLTAIALVEPAHVAAGPGRSPSPRDLDDVLCRADAGTAFSPVSSAPL